MDKWIVHKFGGSSVADADCFRRVADIIEASPNPREAVVLSACRGVTDALLDSVALAERPDGDMTVRRSRSCGSGTRSSPAELLSRVGLRDLLHAARTRLPRYRRRAADGAPHPRGDLLDARRDRGLRRDLVDAAVRAFPARARPHPGRGAVGRCARGHHRRVGPARTRRCNGLRASAICAKLVPEGFRGRLIVTGFVATTTSGMQTTLGRNGSDFSGSIFGALARGIRDHHLDRCRRRAVGGPAARAASAGDRSAVLQRGHGARLLRRQGDPSADDGAGGRARHSDLDPQHVRAAKARHADLRASASRRSR